MTKENNEAEEVSRKAERRYYTLFEGANDAIFIMKEYRFVECNKKTLEIFGCERTDDLIGHTPWEFSPQQQPDGRDSKEKAIEVINAAFNGKPQRFYWKHNRKDKTPFDAEVSLNCFEWENRQDLQAIVRDITEQNRTNEMLRLNESRLAGLLELSQMSAESEKELTDFVLEKAIDLTGSTIGYLAFMNPDESVLTMYSWSKAAMRECTIENKPIEYPVENTGLWGEAVRQRRPLITNNYQADNPLKKGYPEGHVQICRHMNIPLFDGERIVLVAGVGNKKEPYGSDDVEQLTLLMDGMWKILKAKRAEEALQHEKQRFHILFQNAPFGMLVIDKYGIFRYANPKFTEIFGYDLSDIPNGKKWFELAYPDPEYRKQVVLAWIEDLETYGPGEKRPRVFEVACWDGSRKVVNFIPVSLKTGENLIACEDITERIALEDQLRHAQKMESVGRLAGGVAHDFNNMLQAIMGYAELAMLNTQPGLPPDANLIQIKQAAQRSADLVRQLLAFARKQTVSPKVLDLNDTMSGMLKILRQLIGEDIKLVWKPGREIRPVKIDPVQIDQILANLLVNARDSISGVGIVAIETGNAVLDEAYCRVNPGFVPGKYALLSVSDTGSGMDKETVSHIFEPFFTTKEVGNGTGLGLSTVYGIVKQNGGFINVYSEPGRGTTFQIYLPCFQAQAEAEDAVKEQKTPGGTETVLIVEDEKMILEFVRTILEDQGYKVLAHGTPADALIMAREYNGPIHLLITDVVMPGMNGRELKEALMSLYPDIKTLYMSGYTADVIAIKGIIDEGTAFLQKPFTIDSLALKVREVLDG